MACFQVMAHADWLPSGPEKSVLATWGRDWGRVLKTDKIMK